MTQMDEPVKPGARLEVSVSFGRFENDALSWEKWSSFSPNKYLEEAGNLSTPGSVAQKKAYFEAHYKKIAARKAELEQEKMMVPIMPYPPAAYSSDTDSKFGLSNGERSFEEVAEESCTTLSTNGPIFDEEEDDDNSDSPRRGDPETYKNVNGVHDDDYNSPKRDDLVTYMNVNGAALEKRDIFAIEETKDEVNGPAEGPQLNASKDDVVLVESATSQKNSRNTVDKQANALRKGVSKMNVRNTAQKVTPTIRERTLGGAKNKVVSPVVTPSPGFSTPRNSKPSLMNTPASAPKTLKKQAQAKVSPLLKSKNSSLAGQSKRGAAAAAPTALHMSLSLSSANSLSTVSMTRKSLIMEKMGDKDIVKRAFKAFQNRTSGPAVVEKLSPAKHMSPVAVEPKVAASRNLTRGNERRGSINQATQRTQSGTRSNPLPKGLHKSCAMERKDTMAFALTIGLRNDEKAQKRKEFLKNLEAKAIAREANKAQLSAKSKVRVGNEIHPQRPTLSR